MVQAALRGAGFEISNPSLTVMESRPEVLPLPGHGLLQVLVWPVVSGRIVEMDVPGYVGRFDGAQRGQIRELGSVVIRRAWLTVAWSSSRTARSRCRP